MENVVGILSAKFRIFQISITLKPENIDNVVMTLCVMHNFVRRKCASVHITGTFLEASVTEENPIEGLRIWHNRNYSSEPRFVLELFVSYLRTINTIQTLFRTLRIVYHQYGFVIRQY